VIRGQKQFTKLPALRAEKWNFQADNHDRVAGGTVLYATVPRQEGLRGPPHDSIRKKYVVTCGKSNQNFQCRLEVFPMPETQ